MCPVLYSYFVLDEAISLYSSQAIDEKEILCIVSTAGIYCSNDKVGTAYLVYMVTLFRKIPSSTSTALCNPCEYIQCTLY